MSMSFACVSHSSDPLAAIAFSSWRVGGIVLLLVVVDSNVLEERTNEVSLVGGGGIAVRERESRLFAILGLKFVGVPCLCRLMSTGFGLVLSPAPPLQFERVIASPSR